MRRTLGEQKLTRAAIVALVVVLLGGAALRDVEAQTRDCSAQIKPLIEKGKELRREVRFATHPIDWERLCKSNRAMVRHHDHIMAVVRTLPRDCFHKSSALAQMEKSYVQDRAKYVKAADNSCRMAEKNKAQAK
jgi:hypothetical protein